jgi:hypothetical protein
MVPSGPRPKPKDAVTEIDKTNPKKRNPVFIMVLLDEI